MQLLGKNTVAKIGNKLPKHHDVILYGKRLQGTFEGFLQQNILLSSLLSS